MNYILIIIIAIIAAMVSISQYSAFIVECKEKRIRVQFLVLSFCIAVCACLQVAMLVSYGMKICFIMYAFDKFFKVIIMGFVILLTQEIVGINKKYISYFVSVMAYGAVALFIIDSFFQGGELERGVCGVFFSPHYAWLKLLYCLYYMLYDVILLSFVIYKASVVFKKRYKYEMYLQFMTYAFSAIGFSLELFIMINGSFYVPVSLFTNIASLYFMRKLLNYHSSIQVNELKFARELDPSRLDVTFVLDDEMNIIYQNKKGEILSHIFSEEYVGRKLSEVFKLNDGAFSQMSATPDEIPFGITADYEANNHHVNMVVQHRVDRFSEILASIVYVYNMEDDTKNELKESDNENNEELITDNVISITRNARVLIIDEDIVFANVFTRILKQYEVLVDRSFSGYDGINEVKDKVYDIIFVALEMKRIDGIETVRSIRKLSGEYYKQVPICYLIQSDVNDIFDKFVDTGFNDYLAKPIKTNNLSLVLTRWLWQRFGNSITSKAEAEIAIDSHVFELSNLMELARVMYEKSNYIYLSYVTKAVLKCAMKIGHVDLAKNSEDLFQAILIENTAEITRLYNLMKKSISELTTI